MIHLLIDSGASSTAAATVCVLNSSSISNVDFPAKNMHVLLFPLKRNYILVKIINH